MIPAGPLEDIKLISNASGCWGCGFYQGYEWDQLPWKNTFQDVLISAKKTNSHCDNIGNVGKGM